jgi:hypothetical protein
MKLTASAGAVPGVKPDMDEADLRAAERLSKV